MNPVWLDITRLLERACAGTLTGIDRVELAYAETLPSLNPSVHFVVFIPWQHRIAVLSDRQARGFIDCLAAAWRVGHPSQARMAAVRLLAYAALTGRLGTDSGVRPVYLLVSHRHLERQAALAAALDHADARLVALIHDLIPLEYPEYTRPEETRRHVRRLASVRRLAAGVVVNSVATRDGLSPYLHACQPVLVAPLGIAPPCIEAGPVGPDGPSPYFVCLSTIEPRKNHLLLLHVWRDLVGRFGDAAPHLLLVGHRGRENGHVFRLLARCPALRRHVRLCGAVPDRDLRLLLTGARALLMPSFAEGYGLPVAEALATGTPVLSSDLPALRETGGSVPEYLDPLDAPAWIRAIIDYAADPSPRRAAQLRRLSGWRVPSWTDHLGRVLDFLPVAAGLPPLLPAQTPRA